MWGYVSAHYDLEESKKANRGIVARDDIGRLDSDVDSSCDLYYYDEGRRQKQCRSTCAKQEGDANSMIQEVDG